MEEYTKEELLDELKNQTDIKLKHSLYLLTTDEVDEIKNMPSMSSYYKKFNSLKEAYLEIGINYDSFNLQRVEEDMKNKYVEIRNIIGRTPNSRDLEKFSKNSDRYYGCTTYLQHFGSMSAFHKLMGDKSRNWTNDLSDDELLQTLIKLSNDLGIVPNQKEVELCEYCGSIKSYVRRFGSFTNAIRSAGMIPRSKKEPLITPKGSKALSGYEYKFMLMLEQHNISFGKEELYNKYIKDFERKYRFDFTLTFNDELYFVEIFGITGNTKYDNKTLEKIQLCKENNLNLICLYPNDIGFNSFEEIYSLLFDNINKLKTIREEEI